MIDASKSMSGQISSRPHTTKNTTWWFSEVNSLISGKPRLVKYYTLPRYLFDDNFVSPVCGLSVSVAPNAMFFRVCQECSSRAEDVWRLAEAGGGERSGPYDQGV